MRGLCSENRRAVFFFEKDTLLNIFFILSFPAPYLFSPFFVCFFFFEFSSIVYYKQELFFLRLHLEISFACISMLLYILLLRKYFCSEIICVLLAYFMERMVFAFFFHNGIILRITIHNIFVSVDTNKFSQNQSILINMKK